MEHFKKYSFCKSKQKQNKPPSNLDASLHWRMQTFFLKMCIYAWGLTLGSVKNTSKMRKMWCVGLEEFGIVPCEKLSLLPHPIKIYCLDLKCTTPIKKMYSIDALFKNENKHVSKEDSKNNSQRVTLEHFRNMLVVTLVLAQMSLRKRRWGEFFGKIPPILLSSVSVSSN